MIDSPFDELAAGYDRSFTQSPVGSVLRQIVREQMARAFEPGQSLLEIGCGTGDDALWLARRGVRVTAIDASAGMIGIAKAKLERDRPTPEVELCWLEMEQLASRLGDRSFDAVFSNFGAINCSRDLASTARDVAGLVRPGGQLLWTVMGRHVPWEWAWYVARGDWTKATRRYRAGGTPWRGARIVYPTPRELSRLLQPWFSITHVLPLGCVLPPGYAASWSDRLPRVFSALARLEHRAARAGRLSGALAAVSDHFVIRATRRSLLDSPPPQHGTDPQESPGRLPANGPRREQPE